VVFFQKSVNYIIAFLSIDFFSISSIMREVCEEAVRYKPLAQSFSAIDQGMARAKVND